MASVVQNLGRATAKVHCASDEDSDQNLVKFQTEEAIVAVVEGRRKEFVQDLTDFAIDYAEEDPHGPRVVRGRLPRGHASAG